MSRQLYKSTRVSRAFADSVLRNIEAQVSNLRASLTAISANKMSLVETNGCRSLITAGLSDLLDGPLASMFSNDIAQPDDDILDIN